MHKIKHHIGSHIHRWWSCSNVQLPKQISMEMKTYFPPAKKKNPQTPSNIDSSGKATSRPAISAKCFLRLRSSSARASLNLRWVCMLWKRTWEIKYRKATLLLVSMLPSMLLFQCLLSCFPASFWNHKYVNVWEEAPERTISDLLTVEMDLDAYY